MKQGLKVTLVALLMMIGVVLCNSSFAAVPSYTYTGTKSEGSDSSYWYLYLKSSGTLTFTSAQNVDIFLVGGGGGRNTSSAANYISTGRAGGSGIVIVRGKLCTSHTGGTHSNG